MKTINKHLSRFDLGNTKTKHKAHHQNWGGQKQDSLLDSLLAILLVSESFFVWADVFCKIVTSDFRSFLGFYITNQNKNTPSPASNIDPGSFLPASHWKEVTTLTEWLRLVSLTEILGFAFSMLGKKFQRYSPKWWWNSWWWIIPWYNPLKKSPTKHIQTSSKPEKKTKKSVGKNPSTDVFRRSFGAHPLNLRDPALLVARNQVPTFADWEMMGPIAFWSRNSKGSKKHGILQGVDF